MTWPEERSARGDGPASGAGPASAIAVHRVRPRPGPQVPLCRWARRLGTSASSFCVAAGGRFRQGPARPLRGPVGEVDLPVLPRGRPALRAGVGGHGCPRRSPRRVDGGEHGTQPGGGQSEDACRRPAGGSDERGGPRDGGKRRGRVTEWHVRGTSAFGLLEPALRAVQGALLDAPRFDLDGPAAGVAAGPGRVLGVHAFTIAAASTVVAESPRPQGSWPCVGPDPYTTGAAWAGWYGGRSSVIRCHWRGVTRSSAGGNASGSARGGRTRRTPFTPGSTWPCPRRGAGRRRSGRPTAGRVRRPPRSPPAPAGGGSCCRRSRWGGSRRRAPR